MSKLVSNKQTTKNMTDKKDTIVVSDDTFDLLEAEVDKFNETKSLSEKIEIHSQLSKKISLLEDEINGMIKIIDDIDKEDINISDDTSGIEIDDLIDEFDNEEILQKKLSCYIKMINKVKMCKKKCEKNTLSISRVN